MDDNGQDWAHQEECIQQELESLGGRHGEHTTEELMDLYRSLRPEDAWRRTELIRDIARLYK